MFGKQCECSTIRLSPEISTICSLCYVTPWKGSRLGHADGHAEGNPDENADCSVETADILGYLNGAM